MDDELTAALARVRDAFARYPRRAVLDGCPHCKGSVVVDEHDLFSLTISLGSTVGDRDDVKSLLPVLLERLLVSGDLYPAIVLGKASHEEWRTWPRVEQEAVDGYLDAVWRSLLADHPSRLGSFTDPATFLDAARATGEPEERFLAVWDATLTSSADRHLAEAVSRLNFTRQKPSVLGDWLRRDTVRHRLHRAFERDHDTPWADDLARAHDLLRPTILEDPSSGSAALWSTGPVSQALSIPPADVEDRLSRELNVWLCTLRRDGSPHLTPVWFVYLSATFWVGCESRSVKARNVLADPRVSLALEGGNAPVVAEGAAHVHRNGFPGPVVEAFARKYDGWDVGRQVGADGERALLEIPVRRWLLAGTAQ